MHSQIMKRSVFLLAAAAAMFTATAQEKKAAAPAAADGWVSLFDGKTLDGWKINGEVKDVAKVEDGALHIKGGRGHVFYVGDGTNATFTNFEFKAKVMTKANANSGIYFHTEFQDSGWPKKGYECQVNNSFDKDPRRTGSLYAVQDVKEKLVPDDQWFDYAIKVEGKHITISINGKQVVDYTEKAGDPRQGEDQQKGRWISSGTFAFQAHDPGCEVFYKDIMVKRLP